MGLKVGLMSTAYFVKASFLRKAAAGDADDFAPVVGDVGDFGEGAGGHFVANGDGELLCHEGRLWGDDGGTEDFVGAVGDDFDEAVAEICGVAGLGDGEGDDDFADFAVVAEAIVFGDADGGDGWPGAGGADEAGVVGGFFAAVYHVGHGDAGFEDGSFGRAVVAASDVAGGVDVFEGGLEGFFDFDAVVGELDASVLEAEICGWGGAGAEEDFVNADGFFLAAAHEGDFFADGIFGKFDNAGLGEDFDAEAVEDVVEDLADFFVFTGQEAAGDVGDEDFGAEFGKILG